MQETQPDFPTEPEGSSVMPSEMPHDDSHKIEAMASEVAPRPEPAAFDFNWEPSPEASAQPIEREPAKPGKVKLGPIANIDMADFFTEDGIGKIAARGLDGFYRTCGAEEMDRAEFNQVAKVFAYYCQARLPSDAKDYQPEILLIATLGMTTLPRLGPVVNTAIPWYRRGWAWVKGLWQRKKVDDAESS